MNVKIKNLSVLCLILFFLLVQMNYPSAVNAQESLQQIFDHALHESKNGNFLEALNDWNRFLEKSPSDAAALSNRGNCFLALGEPEKAIIDQTKAIEIMPLVPDSYLKNPPKD